MAARLTPQQIQQIKESPRGVLPNFLKNVAYGVKSLKNAYPSMTPGPGVYVPGVARGVGRVLRGESYFRKAEKKLGVVSR